MIRLLYLVVLLLTPYRGLLGQNRLGEVTARAEARLFTPSGIEQGRWLARYDSVIAVRREGLTRRVPISVLDSVKVYVPARRDRGPMIGLGILGAGALFYLSHGLCDYGCTKNVIGASLVGGAAGALLGTFISAAVSASHGEWQLVYRK